MVFSALMDAITFPISEHLTRIGLDKKPDPDEKGLRAVHAAQAFSIPLAETV
jgi:hypothetical protein